ncbi:hypothetical protein TIFTF001_036902 [Ficus carica]|nr:hypothetical protein TIFTF001_036902 [Ficus carica]
MSILAILKSFKGVIVKLDDFGDMHNEFGVSFNYLRAWQGKEATLTSLRGDDAESYKVIVVDGSALKARFRGMLLAAYGHDANGSIFPLAFGIILSETNESRKGIEYAANIVYPDADFGICLQHLAANLKTRQILKFDREHTSMDGGIQSYNQHCKVIEQCGSESHVNAPRPADQFEYTVTNKAAQTWIVAYAPVVHLIGSPEGWDIFEEVRSQIVNSPKTKRGLGRPMVSTILSQGEEPKTIWCGRCHGNGYNRQTYTNPVPLCIGPITRSQRSLITQSVIM